MDSAVEAGLVAGEPSLFASNTLTIVTPPGNPAEVEDLEDLADNDVVTVVCAPQVPCGAATEQVTEAAGVALSPASEESAVTDVLGKVRAGEADAGLVYVTDARGAGEDVETIDFPEAHDVVNLYPARRWRAPGTRRRLRPSWSSCRAPRRRRSWPRQASRTRISEEPPTHRETL